MNGTKTLETLLSEAEKLARIMDDRNEMREELVSLADKLGLLKPEIKELPDFCETVRRIAGKNQAFALTLVANAMSHFSLQLSKTELDLGLSGFALTEPGSGSDMRKISTRFENGKLWGVKTLITNAELAENFAVLAKSGDKYLLCFVERDEVLVRKLNVSAFRGSGIGVVKLRGARAEEVVEDGLKMASSVLNHSRPAFSSVALGIAERCLEIAVNYAKRRKVFGKTVFDLQKLKLAECHAEIEALRSVIEKASRNPDPENSAVCKLLAAKTVKHVADCSVQVLAGHGLIKGCYVERAYRDAKAFDVGEGTTEIMKLILSKYL